MKTLRKYAKEFKLNAVKLYQSSDKSCDVLAEDLGVPKNTLYTWIKQYREQGEQSFPGSGKIAPCDAALHQLQKELADVKLERDILKKAIAIFSRAK